MTFVRMYFVINFSTFRCHSMEASSATSGSEASDWSLSRRRRTLHWPMALLLRFALGILKILCQWLETNWLLIEIMHLRLSDYPIRMYFQTKILITTIVHQNHQNNSSHQNSKSLHLWTQIIPKKCQTRSKVTMTMMMKREKWRSWWCWSSRGSPEWDSGSASQGESGRRPFEGRTRSVNKPFVVIN